MEVGSQAPLRGLRGGEILSMGEKQETEGPSDVRLKTLGRPRRCLKQIF